MILGEKISYFIPFFQEALLYAINLATQLQVTSNTTCQTINRFYCEGRSSTVKVLGLSCCITAAVSLSDPISGASMASGSWINDHDIFCYICGTAKMQEISSIVGSKV